MDFELTGLAQPGSTHLSKLVDITNSDSGLLSSGRFGCSRFPAHSPQ
jgi:hypothetical protein